MEVLVLRRSFHLLLVVLSIGLFFLHLHELLLLHLLFECMWVNVILSCELVVFKLFVVIHLIFSHRFGNNSKFFLSLQLEIVIFALVHLSIDAFNFKLVSVNLGLVLFKFSYHFFELLSSFFKILLIDYKFFHDFRTWLLCQNVFEFNVKFFFFLNKNIFFRDFFSFCNKSLLQTLNFLDQFVSFNVCWFQLSPTMNI